MEDRTSQPEGTETETALSEPDEPPAENGEAREQPDVPEGDEEGEDEYGEED